VCVHMRVCVCVCARLCLLVDACACILCEHTRVCALVNLRIHVGVLQVQNKCK
jgi:hypothetical protein